MELDVFLKRDGDASWGFSIIGGRELGLPFTIIEILPGSPAEKAGLQKGDVMSRVQGKPTRGLSLEEILLLIDEAEALLDLGLLRGLYDPVIDDQEPVFEEPADFDRRSQPTEVPFTVQNFDDPSKGFGPHYVYDEDGKLLQPNFTGEPGFLFDNGQGQYLYGDNPANLDSSFSRGVSLEPFSDISDFNINDRGSLEYRASRSLTASPFSVSSKPYRPFSTEPLKEIPPVEDPIILNPEFKDDFGYKWEEKGVESVLDLPAVEPTFKLPKSEKYDPNWEDKNKTLEEKLAESIKINKIMNERLRKSAERVLKEINKTSVTEVISKEKKETFECVSKVESKRINISSWELSEQFKREVIEAKKKLKEERNNVQKQVTKNTVTLKEPLKIRQESKEKEFVSELRKDIDLNELEQTAFADENLHTTAEVVEEVHKKVHSEEKSESTISCSNVSERRQDTKNMKNVEKSEHFAYEENNYEENHYKRDSKALDVIEETANETSKNTLKQSFEQSSQEMHTGIESNVKLIEVDAQKDKVKRGSASSEEIKQEVFVAVDETKTMGKQNELKQDYIEESFLEQVKNSKETFDSESNTIPKLTETKESINNNQDLKETVSKRKEISKNNIEYRKTDSEQRVHTIGLQTIPNIRGVVHSQHYDLLLKTFFIHLTDVMVALSRFMLTQPVFSDTVKDTKAHEEERRENERNVDVCHKFEQRKGSYIDAKMQRKEEYSSKQSKKELSKDIEQRKQQESYIDAKLTETENYDNEVKRKSFSKMSQKSEEQTQKMNKVISQLQNKSEEVSRLRRSSSRSSIEEEVAKESDPLEWLDKVNSRRGSQDFTETNKKLSNYKFESKHEAREERKQSKIYRPRSSKQTYIAVVEAHVYTNPDVIFEDYAAELEESVSYMTAESNNMGVESNQAIITENIAVQNAVSQETSTAKIQTGHTLSMVDIKNHATVKMLEENLHNVKNIEQIDLEQKAVKREVESIKKGLIQETKEAIEPVTDFKHEVKLMKKANSTNQELLIQTAAERTETDESSKNEFMHVEEFKTKNAAISRGNFSALQVTEVATENSRMQDLQLEKVHEFKAEKCIDAVTAIQMTEVKTEKDEIGELMLIETNKAIANKGFQEANASAVEVSEVKSEIEELLDFELNKQKVVTADEAFEEARSITVSETLVDKIEVSDLTTVKPKEVIAVTKLDETNVAVQIEEVNLEKDEIDDMKISKNIGAIAARSYEESAALEISEVHIETGKEEIQELKVSKNIELIAETCIEEAKAIEVAEYKSEKDELSEFKVANKREAMASEAIEASRSEAEVTQVQVNKDLEIETASVGTTSVKTEKIQDEFAELKIIKHQEMDSEYIDELDSSVEITEVTDVAMNNEHEKRYSRTGTSKINVEESLYEVSEMSAEIQNDYSALNLAKQQLGMSEFNSFSYDSVEINQSAQHTHSVLMKEQVEENYAVQQEKETTIMEAVQSPERTPSPDLPTPLVDEYVFKLEIPLPKGITPVPPDPSPVDDKVINYDEDPHIVKKKLVPHIDLSIESAIFDPPLKSPEVRVCSPVYRKPGLRGGADRPEHRREEIREIERKSSLLTSAIDQTIRSIEEYKEEVGMESKKEVKIETSFQSESGFTTETSIENSKEAALSNDYTEKSTNSIEITSAPILHNGLDAEKDEVNPDKDEISKGTEASLSNEEIRDASTVNQSISVEKHVEDIKKIVQNTENILNLTVNGKIDEGIDVAPINDKGVTKIDSIELKENLVNDIQINKSENTSEGIVKEDIQTSESNLEDDLKENTNIDEIKNTKIESKDDVKLTETSKDINTEIASVGDAANGADKTVKDDSANDLEVKNTLKQEESRVDPLQFVRPVEFHPENIRSSVSPRNVPVLDPPPEKEPYKTENGEILGTRQGIVDGLEEALVDEEVAKQLGKPGLPDEKIAELISGEAEMLREAHVMGLSRVISCHMHREDDSSVDFSQIRPLVSSLKDSEVLKALNEEMLRANKEREKGRLEKRWTTFLQKPARPVPNANASAGYPGHLHRDIDEEPYKVKIVKQPKPKVAPDYKPEDFETGPLPWEERQQVEVSQPPPNLVPEEPILIPEEAPQFLEAVDPLPESEVPDLEDTGIPLPPPVPDLEVEPQLPEEVIEVEVESEAETVEEVREAEGPKEMENNVVEQLVRSVHDMVDPAASLEQQLVQMRSQLAALAVLPGVIQQTLELVSNHLTQLTHQQNVQVNAQTQVQSEQAQQDHEASENAGEVLPPWEESKLPEMNGDASNVSNESSTIEEVPAEEANPAASQEEIERMKREEEEMIQQQRAAQKQKKEGRARPKPAFGPLRPHAAVVLPGGRRWRGPKDAFDEELIRETLTKQAELIQGKALGVNFMKYERPPPSLEHLKHSEVFKALHELDEAPLRRVEMLTPVLAEADYRERCRSRTPNIVKPRGPQQLMP